MFLSPFAPFSIQNSFWKRRGTSQVKPKDLTAAIFLLGGVTFVMSLFYLVPLVEAMLIPCTVPACCGMFSDLIGV